jgi:hypothetical protein
MKIVEINLGTYGSTGTIMHQIADLARREGHVVITCAPYSRSNNKRRQKGDFLYGCIPLRLISEDCDYDKAQALFNKGIDYDLIQPLINQSRDKSIRFLTDSLKPC